MRAALLLSRNAVKLSSFPIRSNVGAFSTMKLALPLQQHPLVSSSSHKTTATDMTMIRSFASSSSKRKTQAELAEILERELDEEMKSGFANKLPEELAIVKKAIEKDWTIVEDGATIKLFKKEDSSASAGAPKVAISVHCQDTIQHDEDQEEQENEDEEEERSPPLRFNVVVSKAGKSLILTCVSEDAEAYVEMVAMGPETSSLEELLKTGVPGHAYQGPAFQELAEDLQESFNSYLGTLIDEDVAVFLPMYADYVEQQHYVQFLKQAKSVVL